MLIGGFVIMKQLNIAIPDELSEQIRQLAFDKRITKRELVTRYLEEAIKRETNQSNLDG